jgi:hypothetical protein
MEMKVDSLTESSLVSNESPISISTSVGSSGFRISSKKSTSRN